MQKRLIKKSKNTGATYVEMAFSITLFMFIIVTVIELMRFGYTIATMQHILDETIRVASISKFTGVANPAYCDSTNPIDINTLQTSGKARSNCIKSFAKLTASKFGLLIGLDTTNPVLIKSYPQLNNISASMGTTYGEPCDYSTGTTNDNAGLENQYVSVCINYDFNLFMGIKKRLNTFAITKNEPFKD